MATKKNKNTIAAEKSDNDIKFAQIVADPTSSAVLSMAQVLNDSGIDVKTLQDLLLAKKDKILCGDLNEAAEMLFAQAQTLQCMFNYYAARISHCDTQQKMQSYSELAFKASNSCRKALLALSQIKNPTAATFIRQQNNAVNQQVNNQLEPDSLNHANELLCEASHEKLDIGGASKAVSVNSQMETLETRERT